MFGLSEVVDSGKLRFIVIDGSTVQEPGATATTYRLHIAVDLINLSLHQVEITTDKEGENLDHYTLAAGDVVLIDRGYNPPKTLVPFIDRGGDVVLRYNPHSMNLYEDGTGDETGRLVKIDGYTRLHRLGKRPGCVPVQLCHGNKRIQGYLHAIPLPEEKAAEARRKAQQRGKDQGRKPRTETLCLSGWVLIFTSFKRLKHRLALENTSGLSWLAAQQDFGAKILADNLHALTVLEAERAVGIAENYKINRTYAFAHLKCCLPRWLLIALPTAWQLWKTLTELARNLIRFKPGATNSTLSD